MNKVRTRKDNKPSGRVDAIRTLGLPNQSHKKQLANSTWLGLKEHPGAYFAL